MRFIAKLREVIKRIAGTIGSKLSFSNYLTDCFEAQGWFDASLAERFTAIISSARLGCILSAVHKSRILLSPSPLISDLFLFSKSFMEDDYGKELKKVEYPHLH